MRRLFLISLAACVFVVMSILSAFAIPVAKPNALANSDGIVLVKGGHGHGHGHHASRWSRPPLWLGERPRTSLWMVAWPSSRMAFITNKAAPTTRRL
jgi:hypothetical protein